MPSTWLLVATTVLILLLMLISHWTNSILGIRRLGRVVVVCGWVIMFVLVFSEVGGCLSVKDTVISMWARRSSLLDIAHLAIPGLVVMYYRGGACFLPNHYPFRPVSPPLEVPTSIIRLLLYYLTLNPKT